MEEYKESTFGSTIRAFAFDGDETKFRSWEGKSLALASSKSFLLALAKAELTKGLTAEEFENAEVEVPRMKLTDPAAGEPTFAASTMRPPWVMENRKYNFGDNSSINNPTEMLPTQIGNCRHVLSLYLTADANTNNTNDFSQ